MISAILVAIAVSIDSLSMGIAYGIRGVKIPFKSILVISMISFFVVITSMLIGNIIIETISEDIAVIISSALLVLLAIWMIRQNRRKVNKNTGKTSEDNDVVLKIRLRAFGIVISILKEPTKADMDISGSIDYKEAIFLGAALAIDSFGIGIGAAVAGASIILTPIMVIIFSIAFLLIGITLGKYYLRVLISSVKIRFIPPFILITLAIIRVLNYWS